jgi:tetratricopeptide (TPR) repeat protein
MRLIVGSLSVLTLVFAKTPLAQSTAAPDSATAARLFASRQWTDAARAYDAITRSGAASSLAWIRLGQSLDSLGRRGESIRAYEQARRAGAPVAPTLFQLARSHAALGATDRALAYLDSAATNGYAGLAILTGAPELAALRARPEYARAHASIERNRFPCRTDSNVRRFDFWIGDWSVQVGGTEVGINRIEPTVDRCALMEHWESRGGGGGKSFNYWDPTLRKWRQLFVFDNGGVNDYTGEWTNGTMRFHSAPALAMGGATVHYRMTFVPIARDTVRQHIEVSRDSARTWTSAFDALYIRRAGTSRR